MIRFATVLLVSLLVAERALCTFSIVAVDTVTHEVGGAGASCITNCRFIDDLHVNLGAIHTQALYLAGNQNYASGLMDLGVAPQDIIDSLVAHDVENNPSVRQYGIVDLVNGGRSAAYTGAGCSNWAGHRTGMVYAIQGNILLGPQIVDTMEYAFTHTDGELSLRLLAALNAAKVPGADTRCLSAGKSAISSFVRVIRVDDNPVDPYCNLVVSNTSGNTDPIDVLDSLYQNWLDTLGASSDPYRSHVTIGRDTLIANGTDTTLIRIEPRNNRGQLIGPNVSMVLWTSWGATISEPQFNADSSYTAILSDFPNPGTDTLSVYSLSGVRVGELADHPIVHYITENAATTPALPMSPALLQVYPNPFNAVATIHFALPLKGRATLSLFDLTGRTVRTLANEFYSAGEHEVKVNGEALPSGIYFVRLNTSNFSKTEKILLLK